MSHLKTVVEVTFEDDEGLEKKDNYYLLHWGLKFDMIPDSYQNLVPVHFTVAICQHAKSGVIEMFHPDQLKVLGVNVKEELNKVKPD
jgi:hypothetical protein